MNKSFHFFILFFCFSFATAFSQTLSYDAEQRLLSFCELYSTVKYYYPDPNLQDFPWDAFAWQGYKIAKTSENDLEFLKRIDTLFRIIAPGVQISRKGFNLARITPKDTLLYPERAFWQHQGGLKVGKPDTYRNSTLNYIYKKPINTYSMSCTLPPDELRGKKMRVSLWIKVEGQKDSVKVFTYKFVNRQTNKTVFIEIKAIGNDWKRYEREFEHVDGNEFTFLFDQMFLFHPKKGTVYIDNLKLEVKNEEGWEKVNIPNADFEDYSSLGKLGSWETMYAFSPLAFADNLNAQNGKYCLKLPVVQNNLLYPPAPIDQPHTVLLPMGYLAYVPLQLYADEKTVFPYRKKQTINNFAKILRQDSLTVNQQVIVCAMQTWAALYHDYPYREADFENKLNRLLLQTICKLDTDKTVNSVVIVQDFLLWINDPHLNLEGRSRIKISDTIKKKIINIPVKYPNATCLTENQYVVMNVIDSIEAELVPSLQKGDAILRIDDINIDSLLQVFRANNISRYIQNRELRRLMVSYGNPEMKVRLLRNDATVDVVFSTETKQKDYELDNRKRCHALQDSLKKANHLFYLNAVSPPADFNNSIVRNPDKILNQLNAIDSLVMEMNQYKALILDVRGRPSSSILHFFNECVGIDLNRNIDILKTAFYPVAQFKRDTLDYLMENKREDMFIHVPVYVLIDYNTISAPERILLRLKESKRAIFIGSNTAGAAGPVCETEIAENIRLVYTSGQIVGLDDNPLSYQGRGIAPDIYVYPTPQGIAEGRDEVLEKAIEIALKNSEKGNKKK